LTTPALATEANGTNFERTSFVPGETRRRGTSRVSDTASKTDVRVAAVYARRQPSHGGGRTSSNFRRCHFDRFVCVTEVYLSISLFLIREGKTNSNVESLIGPLPEYYTFQSSVRDQHPGLRSAYPSDPVLVEAYDDAIHQLESHVGRDIGAYTKLVGTKADILNGRGTASPVSG
jgi:hypothetical protein